MSSSTAKVVPEALSGKFKGTFAYKTLTDRLPVIITKAIDLLCRQRKQIPALLSLNEKDYDDAEEETKSLIEELARLKYELQTDKTIKALDSDYSDTKEWNEILKREENSHANEEVTWFNISWLYAECYLYRRMREIFLLSKHFKQFDQFYLIKEEAFFNAHHFSSNLATHLLKITDLLAQQSLKDLFYFYVMTSLWGNQCDLSISLGEQNNSISSDFKSLENKIIVNDFNPLFAYAKNLSASKQKFQIDIVLDNSSYELFTDLCLVEFFHLSNLFPKERCSVYFHVKKMPWFVSDTMTKDFHWLLDTMEKEDTFSNALKTISKSFKQNLASGAWIIKEHDFWTLPHSYDQMPTVAADMYGHLCKSDFVLFKGDLNYRKLVGDLNWPFTTSFKDSLRQFQPTTAVCSLRTIKADVVVGIKDEATLALVQSLPKTWMETGEYAVVHFLSNIS